MRTRPSSGDEKLRGAPIENRQPGQLTRLVAAPFAEAFPIRVLLDNGVNSFGSDADIVPVIKNNIR